MVDYHHQVIRHTQRLNPQVRRFSERLGDYDYRRQAQLLSFYSVLETPRCARASINHRTDDGVALVNQAFQYVGGSGDALIGPPEGHNFGHTILFLKHPA